MYDQWSSQGYSGKFCERSETQIDFSFNHVEIPQSLVIYLITIQNDNDPLITMLSKKIPLDEDRTTIFSPLSFDLIFAQIHNEYYLIYHI